MYGTVGTELKQTLAEIRTAGLYKDERRLESAQSARIEVGGREVLNFCANNYLGLADHPDVIAAAKQALDDWGFGLASVRFICGTQTPHTDLETKISELLGTEATILYSSCFDANGGVFEVLLDEQDAVISDELNHASLIDGIRLCKAQRLRYRNRDMADLEAQLQSASCARRRLIVTDGVFSMDGYLAPLDEICALAERYEALVLVDDSHAVGFVGAIGSGYARAVRGAGSGRHRHRDAGQGPWRCQSGGYVSARAEIVELLRQRSRPYLFSNALAPSAVAGALAALELVAASGDQREALKRNTGLFRKLMAGRGFELLPGEHAICPVMVGSLATELDQPDAVVAAQLAEAMLDEGVYVIAFSYPVVPTGKARIRVQLSAAHSERDVKAAVEAFVAARAKVCA